MQSVKSGLQSPAVVTTVERDPNGIFGVGNQVSPWEPALPVAAHVAWCAWQENTSHISGFGSEWDHVFN